MWSSRARMPINRTANYMRSIGVSVSRNTLYNYLEYCNDAYIVFPVRRFSYSMREIEQSKPKIYVVDNGIIRVFAHMMSEDLGRLIENIVFLELRRRRRSEELFYYVTGDNREVDFLVRGENGIKLIEVTYELDHEHIRKMFRAMDELRAGDALVLTWDQEDTIERDGRRIQVKPLWRWLLRPATRVSSSSP